MIIETVRVSEQGKDQLVKLKRNTGIQNWNVLCRWALCTSLAEKSVPPKTKIASDSSIEMTWKTFAGEHEGIYTALIKQRCRIDGIALSKEALAEQFKLHLHRGLGYLAAGKQIQNISALIAVAGR